MSMLRWIRLLGPEREGKRGPLWQLTANVLFNGEDGRHVDRAPALRGLNLSGSPEKVRSSKTKTSYDFVAPELLQARIEVTGDPGAEIEGPQLHDFQKDTERPVAIGDHDVLLSPVGAEWPDVEFTVHRRGNRPPYQRIRTSQITVPACRLSGGAIPIRFEFRTNRRSKPRGFTRFLDYDWKATTVLGGRKLVHQSDEKPLVTLVPEGIEVEVWMPNPLVDMLGSAKQIPEIPVRVRIEPDGEGFQARLVRVIEDQLPPSLNLTAQFREILRALKNMKAPMLAETDTRRAVPPFSWQLSVDASGLHVDPPGTDLWRIRIDPDLLTVRLATDSGTGSTRNAIARLDDPKRDATLELVRRQEGTTLRYALTEDDNSPQQLTASYHAVDGVFRLAILKTGGAIEAETPLREAAERRVQPDGAGRYAFLPVKQGTLQIPTVPPSETEEEGAGPTARSAFQGNCVFRRDSFVLELENAADAEISATWKNQKATEVTLRFGRLSGSLREAIWTAEESPTPERLLPTGRLDPAALRELIPRFGPGRRVNSHISLTAAQPDVKALLSCRMAIELEAPDKAVLWTSCTGLPLITAAPMLTLGAASAPSELRSLVPVVVDPTVTLKSSDGSGLVEADVTPEKDVTPKKYGRFAWPYPDTGKEEVWGPPSVQMVSPTAPGLDYALAPTQLPDQNNVQVSLRYDLPVLDELFGLPTGEEPEPEKNPNEDAPSPEVAAGVLSPEVMNGFWAERKYQLAATRTQDARATGWAKLGDPVDGPIGLAQPYPADARIIFSTKYQLGDETRPLGGYSLTWAGGATEELSGEKALIGPMGSEGLPLRMVLKNGKLVPAATTETATFTLTGYAPDAYATAIGLADTRGTSMQAAVESANSARDVARASGFLKEPGGSPAARALFTHHEPVDVLGLGGGAGVKLWARDLPLTGGVFDGPSNPVEGRVGPDAAPFDRGELQDVLYEWRFFEQANDKAPAPYTVRFRELDLAPLRLLCYEPEKRAKILFRAMLDEPPARQEATQPFGAVEPYALGPLLVLEFAKDGDSLRVVAVSAAALRGDAAEDPPAEVIGKFGMDGKVLVEEQSIAFTFDAELTLQIAGLADAEKWRIGATLSAGLVLPPDESADVLSEPRLRFKLFGREIELELTREAEGAYVFDGTGEALPGQSVRVEKVRLHRTGSGQSAWALSIALGASLRLYDGGPQVLAASGDKLRWLGLPNIGPDTVEIDIARGALWIVKKRGELSAPATPVTGIKFGAVDHLDYTAAIVVAPREHTTTVHSGGEAVWGIATAAVQAEISGWSGKNADGPRSRIALRSHSKHCAGETRNEIFLDRDFQASLPTADGTPRTEFAFQNSGIAWDPDALLVTLPANRLDAAWLDIGMANPYAHRVSVTLRGHPIPPEALGQDGSAVSLLRSVPLTLQVRHQLERRDRRVTWRSLDTVMLTTEKLWKNELNNLATFGPRYVASRAAYRDETQSAVNAPGVGPRTSMLSGFDDPKFLKGLGEDDTTLLLLGGGQGVFDAGTESHLFGLPWVAGFDPDADLPGGFRDLMRFAGNPKSWKAAQLDALPFRPAAGALPPKLPVSTSLIGGFEIAEFLRRAAGSQDSQAILARASMQVYFEPVPPDAEVERNEWPFFLSALIALKAALGHPVAPKHSIVAWPVVSLHQGLAGRLLALALPPNEIAAHVRRPARQNEIRLLALTRTEGVSTFPLELGAAVSRFEEAAEELGSVRMSELAASRIAEPQLVGMAEYEERGARLLRARPIRLPKEFEEFGSEAAQLFDPAHQIYPSAALGWPETVTDARPAAFGMRGTADAPVISTEAGLAARSSALSTGAAVSPRLRPARYLATQARSVFEHGTNHQAATLPAPPARHLSLLAPRCRTPLQGAREVAMEKAMAQDANAAPPDGARSDLPRLNASIGLIPPAYSRSFIGLRPGVLQTHIDTMVTDGASCHALDDGAAEFGRSAVMSPVMARQVRTPRSPALPDDSEFDLNTRRRTFVSKFDRHAPAQPGSDRDPAKTVVIRPNAAAMWRLGSAARFILNLDQASLDPDAVVSAQEKGNPLPLELTLLHAGMENFDMRQTMSHLAESGFLQRQSAGAEQARLRAWLAFAGTRIDAVRLSWQAPEETEGEARVHFTLEFPNLDMALLLEELRMPDPNLPAQLHLRFLKPEGEALLPFDPHGQHADIAPHAGENGDLLEAGVPVVITLPIGRKPLRRPTPDIRRRTFLFADPAFDRVLSGPGKSSQILRLNQGDAAMLALDRTEYDLSSTLYLAFGKLEDGAFERLDAEATLAFKLKPKTGPGETPRVLNLSIAGTGMPTKVESAQVYAIPLSRLQAAAPDPAPKPGDSLSVEVTLTQIVGGKNVKRALSVEVPIAERIDDPRPAAVYSAIGLSVDGDDARTLLHAAAPAPDRVEFVDLLADLPTGHIRKRAIFEWRETDLKHAREWPQCTLAKTDRSGGAQLPREAHDISFYVETQT